jgi:hypothetical protein
MSYYRSIHSALTQSLITLNDSSLGGLPIAFEGQNFDPESIAGDIFIDESYLFNEQESLTKTTLDEITGIYQLSIYQRSGKAIAPVLDIIDKITDHYQHNAKFVSAPANLVIVNSGRNNGRDLSGWYIIDVSVLFKVDKLRS